MDFSRIARVRLVERIALPEPERAARTSAAACKAALVAIDGFCGKQSRWPLTIAEIAERMHLSYSAAKRALRQLRRWNLLIVVRNKEPSKGYVRSTYQVCWSNLKEAVETPETYFADASILKAAVDPSHAGDRPAGASVGGPRKSSCDDFSGVAMGHSDPDDGALCAERWGTVPHPILLPPLLPQENSPSSSSLASEPYSDAVATAGEWEEAEAAIRRELGDWKRAAAVCRAQVDAAYVLATVAHWRRAGPNVWGKGALYYRLLHAHPDTPPACGWTPPKKPTPPVVRGLADLERCRAYVRDRGIPIDDVAFWATFRRRLESQGLGDALEEIRFREELAATGDT